jgi:pSer/pThr/pTyr-binding forkhead associated (FHA) protein
MPRLIVEAPEGRREVALSGRIVAGRAPECEIELDDERCSRQHCEFVQRDDDIVVQDLGSSNGTFVNGTKLSAEQVLIDGDNVRIGAIKAKFFEADADFALHFETGEHAGTVLPLADQRVTLGRRPKNHLSFDDIKVSGVHVEIVNEGDHHVLRDLGSTNGTILDGRKIDEVALSAGDRIRLGESDFVYVDLRSGASATETSTEAAPGAAKALQQPAGKSKASGVLALVGLLAVLGAAGWFFMKSGDEGAPTSGRAVSAAPDGTLLDEDWSFEDVGAVQSLWLDAGDAGFGARRGSATSGSYALVAEVEGQEVAVTRRSSVKVSPGKPLEITGQWSVADGCLCSLAVRFTAEAAAEDRNSVPLTVLTNQSRGTGGSFELFEAKAYAPPGCSAAELELTARGSGTVRIDDLVAVAGQGQAPSTSLGELTLVDRGGSYAIEVRRSPLVEFFAPWGRTTNEEGERVDQAVGAYGLNSSRDGASITYEVDSGSYAAEALSAYLAPEVAAAGVTLLLADNSARQGGSFQAQGVRAVLLGSAAERLELAFEPPCNLAASPRGEGLQLRVAAQDTLRVTARADFEAERNEASQLLFTAESEIREGRLGAAWGKLEDIRRRLPYHLATLARVQGLQLQVRREAEVELDALLAEADAAEFLASLERYGKVLQMADLLLVKLEGSEFADRLRERVDSMRGAADTMRNAQREQEASRLWRLVQAYSGTIESSREQTAQVLREALLATDQGTEAAQQAAGQ